MSELILEWISTTVGPKTKKSRKETMIKTDVKHCIGIACQDVRPRFKNNSFVCLWLVPGEYVPMHMHQVISIMRISVWI